MLTNIIKGIASYFRAIPFLFRGSILKYVILIIIISFGIGTLLFNGIISVSDWLGDWLSSFYKWENGSKLVNTIADWLIGAILFIITALVFRYIILVLTAPLMSIVSERVEAIITNNSIPKAGFRENVHMMYRGLRVAMRNIFWEMTITLGLLLLGLVTGIGFILSPLIFFVQSYYAGFGNFDYFLERRMNFRASVNYISSHKGIAIGNGMVYLFLFVIPVIGYVIGPVLATIAATIAALDGE